MTAEVLLLSLLGVIKVTYGGDIYFDKCRVVFQGLKLEYTKREFFISTSPGDSTQIHTSDQFLHQLLLSLHHHLVGGDCHLVPGLAEEPPLGPLDQGGPSAVSASRENEDRHTVADLNDTNLS